MSILIISFLSFLAVYVIHFYWKLRNYPKGPFPLPFVGNLLQFPKKNLHEYLDELSKVYGPCFTIWTPSPTVVLTDYEHVKNAFVTLKETFTYRFHQPPETLQQPHDGTGILLSDGDNWKIQRRTSLRILRDFGLGRNLMEEKVLQSVQEMLAQLENTVDKNNVDMFWPIQLCVGNVINKVLFGYHYEYKNADKFKKLVHIVDEYIKRMRNRATMMIAAFPWLRYVPIIGEAGYHSLKRKMDEYHKFIEAEVVVQMNEYNAAIEPDNFVHAYMQQMEQTGNPNLNMINLCASALDFWAAGMETTSTSLRWHLAYMMKYPEIQDKVRKEILEVVGTSRLPSMSDKTNMPFTQAVIHEVQRHSNMAPFIGSHVCVENTVILGKNIPASTAVMAQIWSVMRNDEVFEDSHKFNPERYLLPDGKTFNKTALERTIPFSIGMRNCVGEGLARMELFLILTALLQKYEFVPTSSVDLTPVWGGVLTPKPYRCRLVAQAI